MSAALQIETPPRMTPEEMRAALAVLGWNQHEVARRLNVRDRFVRRMCSGEREIAPNVAEWISGLVAYVLDHKIPVGWVVHGQDDD